MDPVAMTDDTDNNARSAHARKLRLLYVFGGIALATYCTVTAAVNKTAKRDALILAAASTASCDLRKIDGRRVSYREQSLPGLLAPSIREMTMHISRDGQHIKRDHSQPPFTPGAPVLTGSDPIHGHALSSIEYKLPACASHLLQPVRAAGVASLG